MKHEIKNEQCSIRYEETALFTAAFPLSGGSSRYDMCDFSFFPQAACTERFKWSRALTDLVDDFVSSLPSLGVTSPLLF